MFKQSVVNALPSYWYQQNGKYNGKYIISPYSLEYEQVENFINDYSDDEYEIETLKRVQNVDFYGKFLLKKEQLATYSEDTYMQRMFVVMPYEHLADALFYNLDERRLPMEVEMVDYLYEDIPNDCVLLIVNVLYESEDDLCDSHGPGFTNEHYIEYIVELE